MVAQRINKWCNNQFLKTNVPAEKTITIPLLPVCRELRRITGWDVYKTAKDTPGRKGEGSTQTKGLGKWSHDTREAWGRLSAEERQPYEELAAQQNAARAAELGMVERGPTGGRDGEGGEEYAESEGGEEDAENEADDDDRCPHECRGNSAASAMVAGARAAQRRQQ